MSHVSSPVPYNGDMDHFYDSAFADSISSAMKVPKQIKIADGNSGDCEILSDSIKGIEDKIEMHVPERILVIGQEQHIGTKAPPRELVLEDAVMPRDPGLVRVQTPPRVITLDEHHFPSAFDFVNEPTLVQENYNPAVRQYPQCGPEQHLMHRESSLAPAPSGDGISLSEELIHLRRQMAKLNRRVMAVELDSVQRQQREKIFYAIGLAYFFLKAVIWFNRS